MISNFVFYKRIFFPRRITFLPIKIMVCILISCSVNVANFLLVTTIYKVSEIDRVICIRLILIKYKKTVSFANRLYLELFFD